MFGGVADPAVKVRHGSVHRIGRQEGAGVIAEHVVDFGRQAVPADGIGLLDLKLEQTLRFGCIAIFEGNCSRGICKPFGRYVQLFGIAQQIAQCVDAARPLQQEGEFPHGPYTIIRNGLGSIVVGKRDPNQVGVGLRPSRRHQPHVWRLCRVARSFLVAPQISVKTGERQANSDVFWTRVKHLKQLIRRSPHIGPTRQVRSRTSAGVVGRCGSDSARGAKPLPIRPIFRASPAPHPNSPMRANRSALPRRALAMLPPRFQPFRRYLRLPPLRATKRARPDRPGTAEAQYRALRGLSPNRSGLAPASPGRRHYPVPQSDALRSHSTPSATLPHRHSIKPMRC